MLIDHQPSEIIIMIIFINDNSTIRLKGQHAEGDTLALARPRNQKAPLHSRSTAQPSSASVHSNCTHAYTKHTSPHTHTDTHIYTHTHNTINTRLVDRSDYRPRLGVLRCMGDQAREDGDSDSDCTTTIERRAEGSVGL